jgi:hypothetical protein
MNMYVCMYTRIYNRTGVYVVIIIIIITIIIIEFLKRVFMVQHI